MVASIRFVDRLRDGNDSAIEGFADKARLLSDAEKKMIAEAARRLDEGAAMKLLGVKHWVHDGCYREFTSVPGRNP